MGEKSPTVIAFWNATKITMIWGLSLTVQWLRLHAPNVGGKGSIPGWETKIPHATQRSLKKKNKNMIL